MILEASCEATPSHCTAQGDAACRVVTGDADAKIKQSLSHQFYFLHPLHKPVAPRLLPTPTGVRCRPAPASRVTPARGSVPPAEPGVPARRSHSYTALEAQFLMYHLFFRLISSSLHFL